MPAKVPPTLDVIRTVVPEKWRLIYDPIPDWLVQDKVRWTKYAQITSRLAVQQLEIEKKVIDLEIERVKLISELYKGIK